MALTDDELAELKRSYPDVSAATEGGLTYLCLSNVTLPTGCVPAQTDVLLCPFPREGYPSRLYFAERVQCPANLNWNGITRVLERNWYAFSWKIEPQLRLLQMVQAHLLPLR
jgi:hypothetical protein